MQIETYSDAGEMGLTLRSNLPSVANAKIPATYQAAKMSIAECDRIDECKDWADKSEALASYAKQAGDDALRQMADRIQARAIRRCGELLREIPRASGTRRDIEPRDGTDPRLTRTEAANDAGLSERQRKTALQVANVPQQEFDQAVESEAPPTVTKLAERGKMPAPTKPEPIAVEVAIPEAASKSSVDHLHGLDPKDFSHSTQVQGQVRYFAEFLRSARAEVAVRGAFPKERIALAANVAAIRTWLDSLTVLLDEASL